MKNYIIKNWYYISVFIASIIVLIIVLGNWDFTQKMLLGGLFFIELHFFEEFGFPGGFPWVGVKVELHKENTSPKTWELNNASAFFGNQWFAAAAYVLALLLPKVRFITLAAMFFAFAELIMHLIVFNIGVKSWYNPGLYTTIFGLVPISVVYFLSLIGNNPYSLIDFLLAVVWIAFNYWFAFRSPVYKAFGKKTQYSFSDDEINRASRYMK